MRTSDNKSNVSRVNPKQITSAIYPANKTIFMLYNHVFFEKGGELMKANLRPNQIKAIENIAQDEGKTFDQALQEVVDAGRVLLKNIKEKGNVKC